MNNTNNNNTEFELKFEESVSEAEIDAPTNEYPENVVEFETATEDLSDKSEVLILTNHYRVRGKIALIPGARLTDYITSANSFVAVTDAEVKTRDGNLLFTTPFLDVNRDYIEMIMPSELVKFC